ncbi:MAG: CopG family transcriptional regulator [Proteobacteria bacterium]|nr:CopG family transcriptional regulator [Pseudomonadota bacterium]MCH9749844.1 CopG family transcriptional regulator [Pseudomonadota bacterium]
MRQAINIRLDKEVVQHLDDSANILEKTRTNLIERAINAYFDQLDEMVADKRIDDLKNGSSEVSSLESVFEKAGIRV